MGAAMSAPRAVLGVGGVMARKQCSRNSHFLSQFALLFPEGQEVLEECELSKGQEVEGADNVEELKEHSQSNGEAGGTVGMARSGGCHLASCACGRAVGVMRKDASDVIESKQPLDSEQSCWLLDGEIVVPSSCMHTGWGASSFSLDPEAHGLNLQHCRHSCLEGCAVHVLGGSWERRWGQGVMPAQQCCDTLWLWLVVLT